MARLDGIGDWLDETFGDQLAAAGVPGAAIAVLAGDEVVERAAGVLNLRTGVEATTDSVFQIGSITKGVDGDACYAARRRRLARPGRAGS